MCTTLRSVPAAALSLGLAAMLTLAACGGASDGPSAQSTGGGGGGPNIGAKGLNTDQLVTYAKCLRRHGLNVPDPKAGQQYKDWIASAMNASGGRRIGQTPAGKACQSKVPAQFRDQGSNPQAQDKMLKFAQCIRSNGVDMPDPRGGKLDFGRVNRNSPQFKQAASKCRTELVGGGQEGR